MITYSRNTMNWQEYLQLNSFSENVSEGMKRISEDTTLKDKEVSQIPYTDFISIIANKENIERVLRERFKANVYNLERISDGVDGLKSEFDFAMGKVLWKIELRQQALIDALKDIRVEEFEREAKIFRTRAEEAYINGWYNESLTDFLKAEKCNYQDFAVLFSIANIYLYHKIELENALEYYLKCAKYAVPKSKKYASRAYLFAGWTSYLLNKDDSAIEYTTNAIQINPNLAVAHYANAKYLAITYRYQKAIDSLEEAGALDRDFYIKAGFDADFQNMQTHLKDLAQRLYKKAKEKAETSFLPIKNDPNLEEYRKEWGEEYKDLERVLEKIDKLFAQDTYLGYMDTLLLLDQYIPLLKYYQDSFAQKPQIKDELENLLNEYTIVNEQERRKLVDLFALGTYSAYKDVARNIEIFLQNPFQESTMLIGHKGDVYSISFSPDGKYLASGGKDKTVKLWDVSTGKLIKSFEGHWDYIHSVSFSPDGKYIASGSKDNSVKIWDVNSGELVRTFSGHSSSIEAVSFSPGGQYIISGSEDGDIQLCDVSTGRFIRSFLGHSDAVMSLSFTPDGKYFASGSWDWTVKLWDFSTGKFLRNIAEHTDCILSLSFSPDGKYIATGGNTVKIREVESGTVFRNIEGHTGPVWSVSFSPGGLYIGTGGWDGTVKLRDVQKGNLIVSLEGHTSHINAISFSPDGQYIASGSEDSIIKLWRWKIASKRERDMIIQMEEQKRLLIEQEKKQRDEEENKWQEQQRKRKEEEERIKLEEQKRKDEEIRQQRIKNGECEVCGVKLGFFEKMKGHTKCKEHRTL